MEGFFKQKCPTEVLNPTLKECDQVEPRSKRGEIELAEIPGDPSTLCDEVEPSSKGVPVDLYDEAEPSSKHEPLDLSKLQRDPGEIPLKGKNIWWSMVREEHQDV